MDDRIPACSESWEGNGPPPHLLRLDAATATVFGTPPGTRPCGATKAARATTRTRA